MIKYSSYPALFLTILTFLGSGIILAQSGSFYVTPEVLLGFSAPSNGSFPDRSLQTQAHLHLTFDQKTNTNEWAQWLNRPRTGVSLGYTNFGNNEQLGSAFSLVPFMEFNTFGSDRWQTAIGLGASYFTTLFDAETNAFNRAVSTHLNWSFRAFLTYTFIETKHVNYRAGVGLFHHSNGHTRLPNQGYNSFLVSLSAEINRPSYQEQVTSSRPERTRYQYLDFRAGVGQNVFSDVSIFNDRKEVYTVSGEYGWVFNNTLKIGVGGFYRIYEHYYDYIRNNEFVVREGQEFESFTSDPWGNATNVALYTKAELLLNHIGIEVLVGVNLHKPGYKIDWFINEGWDLAPREIPDFWIFGDFNSKYRFKQIFTTRLGLKYYLKGTNVFRPHNLYAGIHINTNLGQADFTEIGVGYVYNFGFKKRR